MKEPRVFAWEVRWAFPHEKPPEGFPEVMLRIEVVRPNKAGSGPPPPDILECWQEVRQYGYCMSLYLPYVPVRRLPLESKQRIRRRNLWKRLLVRSPMFIEQFYREAVEAQPAHYGPFQAGEFADVMFARTTMGNLAMMKGDGNGEATS